MLETNTALKEPILQNENGVEPKKESSDIATKNDVGQSSGHAISEQAPSPSDIATKNDVGQLSGHAISEQAPSPSFFQRIASFIGRFICPCFWFSKRDGEALSPLTNNIQEVKPDSTENAKVNNSKLNINGELKVGHDTYHCPVPLTGSVQYGKVDREKVIELLNKNVQKVSTEDIEVQIKKDISRFKSYKLQSSEESSVDTELKKGDDAIALMKHFCGDAFKDIVAIANQKMGVYGQHAMEHVVKSSDIPVGSTYAFPGDAEGDPTSEITIKKEGEPSNPRFIITFSNQAEGKSVYQKMQNSQRKTQICNIEIPYNQQLKAKMTVVIEVTNSPNDQVYEKKCLECYNSYTIAPKTFWSRITN
jgi:hypothetical protein